MEGKIKVDCNSENLSSDVSENWILASNFHVINYNTCLNLFGYVED